MPLTPILYMTLQQIFGTVKMSNEGESMVTVPDPGPNGQPWTKVIKSGETYRVCCPFCGETRYRLYISHMYGRIDPLTNRPYPIQATCYNEKCLKDPGNASRLRDMILGAQIGRGHSCMPIQPGRISTEPPGPKRLPGHVIPIVQIPPGHHAVQYLVGERRYSIEILNHYGVGYCVEAGPGEPPYVQDRIIVPIVQNGILVGWQARLIGSPPHPGIPKYFTSRGLHKSSILYNLDNARHHLWPVVVEGVTDVWAVGDSAVALLGKTASPSQISLLRATWPQRPIFVMLDADARQDAMHLASVIGGQNPVILVDVPEGRDPGSLDREVLWAMLRAAAARAGLLPAAGSPTQ